MKTRVKKIDIYIFSVLVVLVISAGYNVFDNQRFIVVEQEITIDRLPPSFDGFRILQISDLHGRFFGENQANLIQQINRLSYDMIAFTGDMNVSTSIDNSRSSSKAILDLLDGIANKEEMFWVDGNTGPYANKNDYGDKNGDLTEIGTILQAKGCNILTLPYAITRGNDKIWVTPEMSEMGFSADQSMFANEKWLEEKEDVAKIYSFFQKAYASFQAINGNDEVKIMLNHTPKQLNSTAEERRLNGDLDYDLILAGHYHGGQLRLPIIGALYIPSPTTGINNSGFFPDQKAVKGLSHYGNVPQYVSAGLGTSGHVRWLSFRLFNTPEINLITLNSK